MNELNSDINTRCCLHGLKQKIGDAAAIGKGVSMAEKFIAMREVAERLTGENGLWNKAGKGTCSKGGLLFRALVELYPDKSAEQLRAYLSKKTLSEQATLRGVGKIAAVIEELKLKDAENGAEENEEIIDTMLDELDGLE